MIKERLNKKIEKLIDRSLYGSKKDRRIRELWNALNHAYSCMETYGAHMGDYEANLDWTPPPWLHDGEYTMEDRLKDIRRDSQEMKKCVEEIQKVMFKDIDVGSKF